jgi:hypothetical protein
MKHPWYVQPVGNPVPDGVEMETDDDTVELVLVEAVVLTPTETVPEVLDVEEPTTLLLDASDVSKYISNLFPAPQYSKLFPGQMKLQSERVVVIDPVPTEFPQ